MNQKEREGILTAEQVQVAFQNVGGKLTEEHVIESQYVKKGDILMVLDSTDTDLAIEKAEAQLAQLDAQIRRQSGDIDINYSRTFTAEEQAYRMIEQQKQALDAANATYANKQLYYDRMAALVTDGAISQLELDNAQMALDVARAEQLRAQQALNESLAGTSDAARTQVMMTASADGLILPTIEQNRRSIANERNTLETLICQREQLAVYLKELLVQKERLTLRAPEDGKILKLIAKEGEMVSPNAPVILLESNRYYYDIYLDETQAASLCDGDTITGTLIATERDVEGKIRLISAAPGFADIRMSREKGQSDLSSFQVRIYTEAQDGVRPGMTVKVDIDEITAR
ncbi:MAG: biotin/lipoyl-binding protein [Selenomonadales bacterium]|nr:biotin/lipoyl-binding protein [Selenomonadales bacterium]